MPKMPSYGAEYTSMFAATRSRHIIAMPPYAGWLAMPTVIMLSRRCLDTLTCCWPQINNRCACVAVGEVTTTSSRHCHLYFFRHITRPSFSRGSASPIIDDYHYHITFITSLRWRQLVAILYIRVCMPMPFRQPSEIYAVYAIAAKHSFYSR